MAVRRRKEPIMTKNILTDIEVPAQLDNLSENQLRGLRDKLIVAGIRKGGIDIRLPRVVEAFQTALKAKSPKAARKGGK
jgi:hypothetical protein